MTAVPEPIATAFADQARACTGLGSPFTARLLAALPARLDPETEFGGRILSWTGDARADALALRAAGALHALARSGRAPGMASAWPPQAGGDPAEAAARAISGHDAWLASWLDSPPQTNEVARAAALMTGLATVAARTGRALELLEIGASAGLNLIPDAYRHELGGVVLGDPVSPVTLRPDWNGPPPPGATPRIRARAACDRAPLDPAAPVDRARLFAYVWPDQPERLARLSSALDLAARHAPRVERADAAVWLVERLATPQPEDAARVVMHSITWQYLPGETQAAIRDALSRAGAAAGPRSPVAWLRLEPDETPGSAALSLTLWPGGRTEALGRADFHGRWFRSAPAS
ncbi:MAG: DUF2332 domain-containing protein [Pseudomonadota bacterium]